MTSARPRRPHSSRQRGGAIVEFALIVGLMITILAGIVEFGRVFWYYDALSKATRNAARAMAVASKSTIASAGVAKATTLMTNAATAAGVSGFSSSNVLVSCLDASFAAATCTDGTAPTAVKVEVVGYSVTLGAVIPFLIGSASTTVAPAPATTMPYMPAS
jgi:Flp pilus assembly protein TadG